MGKFEIANDLAILAAGRNPQWASQSGGFAGTPDGDGDGLYLEDSVVTLVDVGLREEVHRRTARVTATTLDLAADYTVTINGTACVATGAHADRDAMINELVAAINASAQAGVVTATAVDDDDVAGGVDTTVLIRGDVDTEFSIDISATGTGVLACVADASSAVLRMWHTYATNGDDTPDGWRHPFDAEYTIDWRGFGERFSTSGLDRLFVEVDDIAGHASDGGSVTYTDPVIRIGPCVTE